MCVNIIFVSDLILPLSFSLELQPQIAATGGLCAVTWKDSGEKKCARE